MKNYCIWLFVLLLVSPVSLYSQAVSKPVYVIVHGAWGGGWSFKKLDSILTSQGCIVYRPTLTGQGERVHLASFNVGLKTHINDIVNLLLYGDLHNVVLLGHSYGGMVVTGVADSLPGRISKLIYLDAFFPSDGESVYSILGSRADPIKAFASGGFLLPPWVANGALPPKDVPHAVKTFTDTITLNNALRMKIPTTYILTVEKGKNAKDDDFASQADRAAKQGWPVLQLEADHNPQRSVPAVLAAMLKKIGG